MAKSPAKKRRKMMAPKKMALRTTRALFMRTTTSKHPAGQLTLARQDTGNESMLDAVALTEATKAVTVAAIKADRVQKPAACNNSSSSNGRSSSSANNLTAAAIVRHGSCKQAAGRAKQPEQLEQLEQPQQSEEQQQ